MSPVGGTCVCLCCRLGVVVDEDCVCLCCRLGVVLDEDWRSGGALRRLACTRSSLISQTVLVNTRAHRHVLVHTRAHRHVLVHTRAHRHVLAACVANDLPDYLYYYCETCR